MGSVICSGIVRERDEVRDCVGKRWRQRRNDRENKKGREEEKPGRIRKVKEGILRRFDCFARLLCQGKLVAPIRSIIDGYCITIIGLFRRWKCIDVKHMFYARLIPVACNM